MNDRYEVIVQNVKNGRQERLTQRQWERLRNHPTLKHTCRVIKTEPIPQAAIEAQQNSEVAKATRGRKKKEN